MVNPGHATTAPAFEFAPPLASVADLSGFAYVDANRNGTKDSGEAVLSGVLITVAGNGTTTTAGDGRYAFADLDAGTYSVSATASGKQLFPASPLSVPRGQCDADHPDRHSGRHHRYNRNRHVRPARPTQLRQL